MLLLLMKSLTNPNLELLLNNGRKNAGFQVSECG